MKRSDSFDEFRYENKIAAKKAEFESLCVRCGECCGAYDGDPCQNLQFDTCSNSYYCQDYENRLGPQKTIAGKLFECVPILENIKRGCYHEKCAYKRLYP
jgi:uncharacterized cysteine cluster protein YcgN (CxxCxxCC family)